MLAVVTVGVCATASARSIYRPDNIRSPWNYFAADTVVPQKSLDSLRFPMPDRRGDFYTYQNNNPFKLRDPLNFTDSIAYDYKTNQFYIIEKVGDHYVRTPTYLTFEEMMGISEERSENYYFQQRADMLSVLNRRLYRPKLAVTDNLFNRLFGNGTVDIKPQGNVDILAGYQGQNVQNPTLPESARKTGGLDFNMDANINVLGNVGSKLKVPIAYNTQSTFDWMNQLKLEYTGTSDDIVKKIIVGNTSFTTKSSFMASEQSLFGIKTQLQFGKLYVTGVIANLYSQNQSVGLQGGAAATAYQFKADDYDENRHFLLSQYFKANFNKAMSNIPIVTSQVQILNMEVWVTNRNGFNASARQVVALMDLGETTPYSKVIHSQTAIPYPFNNANSEYSTLVNTPGSRDPSQIISVLNNIGLTQVQDFEVVYARKLTSSDYSYNPQVGYISLNQPLQPSDVLAVAFQYSYNGQIYQVGELSTDVTPDTTQSFNPGAQQNIFLKLLKATAQRTNLPIWNLMMKNVYTLKTGTGSYLSNLQQTGFTFNILYSDPSKGNKNYLPAGDKAGVPLLSVLNLDRLNARNDPGPDGIFDYLEGLTVVSSAARIIFPLLQPFGNDLDSLAFKNSQNLAPNYVFYQLYDTIKTVAQTYANVDRYIFSGLAKGQTSSDVQLGAFNVPQGSVVVTAGGQTLKENVDYTVDYNMGTVKIINQAIINSGVPVNVQFENNAAYGTQQRSFMGLRFDYQVTSTTTQSLALGATIERLNERPFFTKTNYNEDPIRNTMYGVDANYRSLVPQLTRWLNKLPNYSTKDVSTIAAVGEAAFLKPGHPPQIGKGSSGTIYIDDFEGSTSSIDLRYPLTSWALASTPQGDSLFPEGSYNDSLPYGYNRAKIAWYNIEPTLQDNSDPNNPVRSYQNFADPRIAPISVQNIFPQQTPELGQAQLITFDIAYYPNQKGPYNFDARPGSVTTDITGTHQILLNPQKRWGGIMRSLDQTDFESANVQYIEFWMQSPFLLDSSAGAAGSMYIDLGSVSEDVLKDGKKQFENGLNTPNIPAAIDSNTVWGRVPANPIQVTNAFSNNASDRPYQDLGFDGLDDPGEQIKFQSYLTQLSGVISGSAYASALADPSSDDYLYYRDPSYDASQTGILGRYKNVNNPQGNSPIAQPGQNYVSAFTLIPDAEDLNQDNTLNELEAYFEYQIPLVPQTANLGNPYITNTTSFAVTGGVTQTWYQFKIPLSAYSRAVGGIPDFKSIQYVRVFYTGFQDSLVFRFAEFQFIRDSWRNFTFVLDTTGVYTVLPSPDPTSFNVTAVNIEQNSTRSPIPYVIPPGIERQQQISANNVNVFLNEQSMSLQLCNLAVGDARGVFKNTNLDLRQYGHLDMFVHAENGPSTTLPAIVDSQLYAIVRLGSDFISNYYEIRIPLVVSPWYTSVTATEVWPTANNLNLTLSRLVKLKEDRNIQNLSPTAYFSETDTSGKVYGIYGNPNLGQVQAIFLGVQNRGGPLQMPACTEVWFDELRLSQINDRGGFGANARVDVKLADLGSLYVSGAYRTIGFGSIDQHIEQRSLDDNLQVNAAINLEMGKLLPKKMRLSIPFYSSVSSIISLPEYDPFDLDIKLSDKLKYEPASERDSIKQQAIDAAIISTYNFTNVRVNNPSGKKLHIWSIENLNFSFSYTNSEHHSPIAIEDQLKDWKASLGYNYAGLPKYWEPLKKKIKSRSPWLGLIRDFNLNYVPSILAFNADINRQFGAYRSRNIDGPPGALPETYDKFFKYNRHYAVAWKITRNLSFDFTALNQAWVDEDSGRLNKAGRQQMWSNFLHGGRGILYQQAENLTYTVPTDKFPLIDWTTFRAGYGATYQWSAASLLAASYGNTISNTQKIDFTGDFNFRRLYTKLKFLRGLDPPPARPNAANNRNNQPNNSKNPPKPPEEPPPSTELHGLLKALAKILTSVKDVSLNYSENSASTIYGYMDSAQFLGMNLKSGEPGLAYILGKQPDTGFVNRLASRGVLTTDTSFNYQNQASFNQVYSISAQLQPARDLNITLNLNKTFGKNYTDLFKDTTSMSGYSHLNPYVAGSFSVSYISVKTLFEKFNPDQVTQTFMTFQNNRVFISNRLGQINPYSDVQNPDGFYTGYGKYAQDVLIPAFIAAYSGESPNSVALIKQGNANIRSDPFSGYLPKPNWRITYNGLSKLPGMNQVFTNFAVSNGYTSSLSMNSFTTALNYGDPLGIGHPGFVDTVTGNFVPFYLVPNITISEQFSPLIDIDMQFVNLMQAKFGYSISRQLSLSLANYQMSETRSTEYTMGLGWKKKGVPLPFHIKIPGKNGLPTSRLENDMTFRLDYSIRDDATTNSFLDQNYSTPVGGQRVRDLAPSIEYVVNNRIQLKFYFDQRRIVPKISTSAPITTTRFGLQIRISLADVVAAQAKVGAGIGTGSAPGGLPGGLPAQQPPPGK